MINELSKEIHENNKAKGFYDSEKNIGEMLALIHSEVSEALECDREGRYIDWNIVPKTVPVYSIKNDENFKEYFIKDHKDTFEDELADIIIRVLDLAAYKKIDIESHIKAKIRYNSLRPYKHGKKY